MAIQKGTGFTNLSKVLQANKGNRLGQTVSGGIQQQVQGVQSKVKSAQEQFQEEAQKNRLDTPEAAAKRQDILGRFAPSSGASGVPQVGQAPQQTGSSNTAQQPAQSPVSEEEIKDFTKFRTGTYTGPKELKDSASLTGQAQQAEELGGLAKSEGGRQELLKQFVGGRNYTTGQRQLDTTILGQQPGQLGAAARQARGATEQVAGANQQAANLAQEYAGRAKIFGQETTQKIGETKAPISSDLDKRVAEAQKAEETRLSNLKNIQDMLAGGEQFKGLDQWTRAGLALQDAANVGILSQSDINMLLGKDDKIGLLQRGGNLGLDMNKLINERITNQIAQNIARTGIASEEDIAKLTALDRLAGKQGTDLEFLAGQGKFAAGKTGFNVGSLEEYIAKTEAEKARQDAAYADKLAAEQARYMNQVGAGLTGMVTGGQQTVGEALGVLRVLEDPTDAFNIAGDAVGGTIQGGLNTAAAGTQAGLQAPAAILEGIAKLNIGGNSIANTEGGRQLLKLVDNYSKLANVTPGAVRDLGEMYKETFGDIGRGNITGAIGSVGGGVAKTVGNAIKNITGSGIKISDEDLKTDIDYTPQDVQRFMDRIKPAAYNYKEEVKDSPLASKNRELGVMAQDLEKSKLGKESVHDTPEGKIVDYDNLEPKMLASIAALNKRLKELENKDE